MPHILESQAKGISRSNSQKGDKSLLEKEAWLSTQLMCREPCGEEAVMSLTLKLGGVALPDVWCPHWIEFRTVISL